MTAQTTVHVLTIKDVSRILRVSRMTVLRMIHHSDPDRRLPAFKVASMYRIFDVELNQYLQKQRVEPEPSYQED